MAIGIMVVAISLIMLMTGSTHQDAAGAATGGAVETGTATGAAEDCLKSFERGFMGSLESDILRGLTEGDSEGVKRLINQSPGDVCVCLDVSAGGIGYYHADNHLSDDECSKYVKVLQGGTVAYDFNGIGEDRMLSSSKAFTLGGKEYTFGLRLIYIGPEGGC
jgi:hypothetical protein